MLDETKNFYCLSCRSLVPTDSAHRLFRTGYYHMVYRMGFCQECHNKQNPAPSESDNERDKLVCQ